MLFLKRMILYDQIDTDHFYQIDEHAVHNLIINWIKKDKK